MINLIFSYDVLQLIWLGLLCLLMIFPATTGGLGLGICALKKTKIADQLVC